MRIIFAGTPEFARIALTALHEAGHAIAAVLTQPDRPAGRGMKRVPGAVKQEALRLGLPVLQPATLKCPTVQNELRAYAVDRMVVAAYGLILPQAVLDLPRFGCLNIHASLLPRWRGAAPIHRAIQAGDAQTGVTIMQMDAGLDTGAMCLQQSLAIADDDTTGSLHDKLAALGGTLIVKALTAANTHELSVQPQPENGVTYAAKVSKAEARLDFNLDAAQLARNIRAFNPGPGAFVGRQETPIKIWQAHSLSMAGKPGTVLAANTDGIVIACGQDALCIIVLQTAGGKRLTAGQWLERYGLVQGAEFG